MAMNKGLKKSFLVAVRNARGLSSEAGTKAGLSYRAAKMVFRNMDFAANLKERDACRSMVSTLLVEAEAHSKPVAKLSQADLIGKRVEIPAHYDLWMQGARFGMVTQFRSGKDGASDYVFVKMDHTQVKNSVKLPREDWEFMKIV